VIFSFFFIKQRLTETCASQVRNAINEAVDKWREVFSSVYLPKADTLHTAGDVTVLFKNWFCSVCTILSFT